MVAVDRIRAGLREMEETGSTSTANMSKTPRLAALVGLDVSLQAVQEHRRKAKNLRAEISSLHRTLAKEIEAQTAKITRDHDDLGWMPDE